MSGQWFSGGFVKAREINESKGASGFDFGNNEKSRFFVTPKEPRQIIFLDDFDWQVTLEGNKLPIIPFCRHEHKIELGGDWQNCIYVTCTHGVSRCLPCENKFKRPYVGAMTILDVTPYKNDKGEMAILPRKKLLVAVPSALVLIETKKQRKENLLGWKYNVARHGTSFEPRVGSDFEPEEKIVDVREYVKKLGVPSMDLSPYGMTAEQSFEYYRKIFEPVPFEQQERMFKSGAVADGAVYRKGGKGAVVPAKSEDSSGEGEESVPY
jgi:hypothetical protein